MDFLAFLKALWAVFISLFIAISPAGFPRVPHEKDFTPVWADEFDGENDVFPVLSGVTYYGYDKSVIKIVGPRIYPVAPGDTRVCLRWRNFTGDFVVHVTE